MVGPTSLACARAASSNSSVGCPSPSLVDRIRGTRSAASQLVSSAPSAPSAVSRARATVSVGQRARVRRCAGTPVLLDEDGARALSEALQEWLERPERARADHLAGCDPAVRQLANTALARSRRHRGRGLLQRRTETQFETQQAATRVQVHELLYIHAGRGGGSGGIRTPGASRHSRFQGAATGFGDPLTRWSAVWHSPAMFGWTGSRCRHRCRLMDLLGDGRDHSQPNDPFTPRQYLARPAAGWRRPVGAGRRPEPRPCRAPGRLSTDTEGVAVTGWACSMCHNCPRS